MANYKKLGYKKRYPRKSTRKSPVRAKGTFKKKVLKIIHEQAEDKQGFNSQSAVAYNGTIDSTTEFYDLLPGIAQGSDKNQRTGDLVRGKMLKVRGHIHMGITTDTDANCRIIVRLLVLTNKLAPSYYSNENNTGLDRLLMANGSAQKFDGYVSSLYLPVNRDLYTVHYDKLHYLNVDQLYHASAADVEVTRTVGQTVKLFRVNIPCKKLLRFGEGLAYPINFRPRICLGYAHVDNSAADTVETQVSLSWISDFTYEDM